MQFSSHLDMEVYSLLVSFDDLSPVEKMVIIDDPTREIRLENEMFTEKVTAVLCALLRLKLTAMHYFVLWQCQGTAFITWLRTEMWSTW